MSEILDDLREFDQPEALTERDIYKKIWTSPRKVFKFIHENEYDKNVRLLLILGGISQALERSSSRSSGDDQSLWLLLGSSVIGGALIGWISYYIFAGLVSWTGKWLNGQGNMQSLIRVFAYALLPAVISLVFNVLRIILFGKEAYGVHLYMPDAGLLPYILIWGFTFVTFILGIYTLVFYVIAISEVQKLSIGKSILNIILTVAVIFLPVLALVVLVRTF